jgi:hypothetical protein
VAAPFSLFRFFQGRRVVRGALIDPREKVHLSPAGSIGAAHGAAGPAPIRGSGEHSVQTCYSPQHPASPVPFRSPTPSVASGLVPSKAHMRCSCSTPPARMRWEIPCASPISGFNEVESKKEWPTPLDTGICMPRFS